jgi:hypothetical protein
MVPLFNDSTLAGGLLVPGVSPCLLVQDTDSHTFTCNGRVFSDADGREKQIVDPAWNRRIAQIGGLNLFGHPNFRAAWGWNEISGNGDLRYPHVPFQWLVLRRFPAAAWGSRRDWYSPRIDEGRWAPSLAETWQEEYPSQGGEEIFHAFDKGVPFCLPYIEERLRRWVNRPKLAPRAQRLRDAREAEEAKEQQAFNDDYERFLSASRAFYGNPFRGYGPKAGELRAKTEPMTPGMNAKFESIHAGRMERLRRQRIEGR